MQYWKISSGIIARTTDVDDRCLIVIQAARKCEKQVAIKDHSNRNAEVLQEQ
jgi:hypothetical protein